MYRSGLYRYFVCTESDCTDIDIQCTETGCTEKTYRKCMYRNCHVPKATYPGQRSWSWSQSQHSAVHVCDIQAYKLLVRTYATRLAFLSHFVPALPLLLSQCSFFSAVIPVLVLYTYCFSLYFFPFPHPFFFPTILTQPLNPCMPYFCLICSIILSQQCLKPSLVWCNLAITITGWTKFCGVVHLLWSCLKLGLCFQIGPNPVQQVGA